jgi:hypothetical protein
MIPVQIAFFIPSGKVNAVNAASALSGNFNNAMLRVTNNSTGPSATALNLQVEQGKAPMRVGRWQISAMYMLRLLGYRENRTSGRKERR